MTSRIGERWARFDASMIPLPRVWFAPGWGDGDEVGVYFDFGTPSADQIVSAGFAFRCPWLSQTLWDRSVRKERERRP